jgi:hypothetical protein
MELNGNKKARTLTLLGVLMLTAASTLGPTAVAHASASAGGPDCYAASCSGLDPSTTNCVHDAYTGASQEIEGGVLELRYSPSCKANWARYTQYGEETIGTWLREAIGKMGRTGTKAWIWIPGQAPVDSINDTVEGQFGTFGPGDTTWTAMVDGTTEVCTSISIVHSQPSAGGMTYDRIEDNYNGKCG